MSSQIMRMKITEILVDMYYVLKDIFEQHFNSSTEKTLMLIPHIPLYFKTAKSYRNNA